VSFGSKKLRPQLAPQALAFASTTLALLMVVFAIITTDSVKSLPPSCSALDLHGVCIPQAKLGEVRTTLDSFIIFLLLVIYLILSCSARFWICYTYQKMVYSKVQSSHYPSSVKFFTK